MASLSSSTNIGSSSASSIRGYGGLASGLDRDSLIEGMTASTRAKIAQQQQKKQKSLWQQEAYRSISSPLVEFSRKYMSYTGSANLSSSGFWTSSSVTSSGTNSQYVSVTGSSSLADSISVAGVKSLAKNASMNSSGSVSDNVLSTGSLNLLDEQSVSKLEGQSLVFTYGSTDYRVTLGSGTDSNGYTYKYSNEAEVKDSIAKSLAKVSVGNGKTLADVIDVQTTVQAQGFGVNLINKSGNKLLISGGSQTALEALGVVAKGGKIGDVSDDDKKIDAGGFNSKFIAAQNAQGSQALFDNKDFAARVGGKSLSFNYNGMAATITFDDEATLRAALQSGGSNEDALKNLQDILQKKLDSAYGTNRITVGSKDGGLSFTTTLPNAKEAADGGYVLDANSNKYVKYENREVDGNYKKDVDGNVVRYNAADTSSVLTLSGGSVGVLGETGAFNVAAGTSSHLNLTATLSKSGLAGIGTALSGAGDKLDTTYFSGTLKLQAAVKALGSNATSLDNLIESIKANNPSLSDSDLSSMSQALEYYKSGPGGGVTDVSGLNDAMGNYVEAKQMKLTINGEDIKGLTYNSSIKDIMSAVNSSNAGVTMSYLSSTDKFSIVSTAGGAAGRIEIGGDDAKMLFGENESGYTVSQGTDAVIAVKYAGSDKEVELTRGSNSFTLDGLNISVSGTFGYKADGTLDTSAAVSFASKKDTDKITSAVSDMVKDFNAIVDLVNTQLTTKPNRDYPPLTSDQKKDMTESQIKAWEDKAKGGLLFNDSDLRSLSDKLRVVLGSGSADRKTLASFGISASTDYGDYGKLVFDETKFRAALESDPDKVQEMFTKTADSSTGTTDGVMASIKKITEQYAATTGATKGILIEKAGSGYAPASVTSNSIQKSINSLDDYIKTLQDRLKSETDRYISQFTNLENIISQMNSQSSYLGSLSS